MSDFQCAQCANLFDLFNRIPKVLPCGHSLCKFCINEEFKENKQVTCPQCSSIAEINPKDLQKTLSIIQRIKDEEKKKKWQETIAQRFNKSRVQKREIENIKKQYIQEKVIICSKVYQLLNHILFSTTAKQIHQHQQSLTQKVCLFEKVSLDKFTSLEQLEKAFEVEYQIEDFSKQKLELQKLKEVQSKLLDWFKQMLVQLNRQERQSIQIQFEKEKNQLHNSASLEEKQKKAIHQFNQMNLDQSEQINNNLRILNQLQPQENIMQQSKNSAQQTSQTSQPEYCELLNSQIDGFKQQNGELNTEPNKFLSIINTQTQQIIELNYKIEEQDKSINQGQEKIQQLEEQNQTLIRQLKKNQDQFSQQFQDQSKEVQELKVLNQNLYLQMNNLEIQSKQYLQQINNFGQIKNQEKQSLKKQLNQAEDQNSLLYQQVQNLSQQLKEVETSQTKMRFDLQSKEDQLRYYILQYQAYQSQEAQIQNLKDQIKQYQQNIQQLKDQINYLNDKLKDSDLKQAAFNQVINKKEQEIIQQSNRKQQLQQQQNFNFNQINQINIQPLA